MIMKFARAVVVPCSALVGAVAVEAFNWEATLLFGFCCAALVSFTMLVWNAE